MPAVGVLTRTLQMIDDVRACRSRQGFGRLTLVFAVDGEVACVQAVSTAESILRAYGYAINEPARSSVQLAVSEIPSRLNSAA